MDTKELEKYRSALIAEKQAKIDEINLRYKKKLDALGVLLEKDEQMPLAIPHAVVNKLPVHKVKNVFQAAREAIQETTKVSTTFSSETLFSYIGKKYPNEFAAKPSDLSGALWRLKKNGEIEVVTKGTGQVSSIYKKTESYGTN